MARMPGATWRPVPNHTTGGQDAVYGVVLHIMEGTLDGTDSWFRNAKAQASSHFGVGKDGRIFQWVDTADRAWAQISGNRTWLSIEHEGHSGDSLTPAQLAATARIVAWMHATHGVQLVPTDSPNGRGIGWHGMGADAWGGHYDCPGNPIKAQRAAIIAAAKGGGVPQKEDDVELTDRYTVKKGGWAAEETTATVADWIALGNLKAEAAATSANKAYVATVANTAAITALAKALGDAHDGVDTAELLAKLVPAVTTAVDNAVENAVVKVDVSVGDNTTTRES
jgi:hypothetical protein